MGNVDCSICDYYSTGCLEEGCVVSQHRGVRISFTGRGGELHWLLLHIICNYNYLGLIVIRGHFNSEEYSVVDYYDTQLF